jgi:hypothetical protein
MALRECGVVLVCRSNSLEVPMDNSKKHTLKHVEKRPLGKIYECSCGQSFDSFVIWEEHALDANAGMGVEAV